MSVEGCNKVILISIISWVNNTNDTIRVSKLAFLNVSPLSEQANTGYISFETPNSGQFTLSNSVSFAKIIVLILIYQDGCIWVWKDGFIANSMKGSVINEFF